jgi:hypothetical protein
VQAKHAVGQLGLNETLGAAIIRAIAQVEPANLRPRSSRVEKALLG